MKKIVYLVTLLLPFTGIAKGNREIGIYTKNSLLLNGSGITSSLSNAHLKMKTSFMQDIGCSYLRKTKLGIVYSGSIEFGYETYSGNIDFPFNDYYFHQPAVKGKQYEIGKTVTYVQAGINVGYRFSSFNKFKPEIIIGEIVQRSLSPIKSLSGDGTSYENAYTNYSEINLTRQSSFGGGTVLLHSLYIGGQIKILPTDKVKLKVGLQYQTLSFLPTNYSINVQYFDALNYRGEDRFSAKHKSIGLILGIIF